MTPTPHTPPAFAALTLEQARDQVRVDTADHDGALELAIAAAQTQLDNELHRPVLLQTLSLWLDGFPAGAVALGCPCVRSVVSVQYTAPDGSVQALDPAALRIVGRGITGNDRLQPPPGGWPATAIEPACVHIVFTAGLATTPAEVPAPLLQWLLLQVGTAFEQQAALDATGRTTDLPGRYVDRKLDAYRFYG